MLRPEVDLTTEQQTVNMQKKTTLTNRFKSGANWFYFIAALSVANLLFPSVIPLIAVLGLAMVQMVTGYASSVSQGMSPSSALVVRILAIFISLAISAGYVLAAYFSHKRLRLAFVAGLVFYALDALLMLLLGQITAAAFHLFGLYGIWRGLSALLELAALELTEPPLSADRL